MSESGIAVRSFLVGLLRFVLVAGALFLVQRAIYLLLSLTGDRGNLPNSGVFAKATAQVAWYIGWPIAFGMGLLFGVSAGLAYAKKLRRQARQHATAAAPH